MVLHSLVASTARFVHWAVSIRVQSVGLSVAPRCVPAGGQSAATDAMADRDAIVSKHRQVRSEVERRDARV